MESSEIVVAFAPIKLIVAGGFLAVNYLANRRATQDMDYLLDPEWAADDDIKTPLKDAIVQVARKLNFDNEWANEDLSLFVTKDARRRLFEQSEKQNIVLFRGKNLIVLAAPLEWALERKLRRIHSADRGRKAELDLSDALAFLRLLKARHGVLLDKEKIRTLNMNKFDVLPDRSTMEIVEKHYRMKYGEDIFT